MPVNARSLRAVAAAVVLSALCSPALAGDDEGQNFQVSPPPIAYPYFTPGRTDTKITGIYFSMGFQDIDFTGGGIDFVVRKATSRVFATDLQLGLIIMGSDDLPATMVFDYVRGDMVIVEGAGKVNTLYFSIPFSVNAEIQAVNTPRFSLIGFVGPNLGITFGSSSPARYRARMWDTNFDKQFPDLTPTGDFGQSLLMTMGGFQGGLQAGIPLHDWRLMPFLVLRATGGSGSMTIKSGYEQVDGSTMSMTIPVSMATSFGMDIVYEPIGLSIGTLVQQVMANKKENEQSTVMIILSLHFRQDQPADADSKAETPAAKGTSLDEPAPNPR